MTATTSIETARRPRILVTGATGQVGRQVVQQLLHEEVTVRAASRNPATGFPPGVESVEFDVDDLATVEAALADVDAVHLMWPHFQSGDEARRQFAPIATLLGQRVRRVVYVSTQHLATAAAATGPDTFWGVVEDGVAENVAEWTMLRPTGFAVNALQWAPQILRGDSVRWPLGEVARPLIHEADIADVAVEALLRDDHVGTRPVLTGPELLTQRAQVDTIGAALGRTLTWQELDRDTASHELDLPEMMLDAWEGFLADPEPVTDTVRQITGRPARSFATWVADHLDDFADTNTDATTKEN